MEHRSQRELFKNLIAEVAYLGNRGVWLEANNLVSHNATPLPSSSSSVSI